MYQPRYNTFQHFNSLTGHRFSTDYLKDIVYDEAYNCLWISSRFYQQIELFYLETHRNEQFTLEQFAASIVGDALFALADTPQKLYVGTTSAVASLDKLTKKTDILFHEDELFTHNYNTLLFNSAAAMICCQPKDVWLMILKNGVFRLIVYVWTKPSVRYCQRLLVNVIYKDRYGDIWIGTHGKGLFLLDKKDSQFHLHTPDYQLSGNNIRDLAETPPAIC